MKTTVGKLREALTFVEMATPKKPSMPELTNAVIRKEGRIEATDLEVRMSLEFPEADGDYLLPVRQVLAMLRRIPELETITVQQEGRLLTIAWETGKTSFRTADLDSLPPFSSVDPLAEGWIDGDTLMRELEDIKTCAATEDTHPVLNGVYLKLGESVEVAAADGFRLAYRETGLSFPAEGIEGIIIPRTAVSILVSALDKLPREFVGGANLAEAVTARRKLYLKVGTSHLEVKAYPMTFTTRLIEGSFPEYGQLIPKDSDYQVRFMGPDLRLAVRQAAEFAREGTGIVRLSWDEERLSVSARADEVGEVETGIPVEIEGGPMKVAINSKYLLDYLRDKEGLVTMLAKSTSSPVRFDYSSGPIVVVMPMFVQWGDTPQGEAEQPAENQEATEG